VAQSLSVAHGIGSNVVEHAAAATRTQAFAMRKALIVLLSQV
jgi:hypothetical protein